MIHIKKKKKKKKTKWVCEYGRAIILGGWYNHIMSEICKKVKRKEEAWNLGRGAIRRP